MLGLEAWPPWKCSPFCIKIPIPSWHPFLPVKGKYPSMPHKYASLITVGVLLHRHLVNVLVVILKSWINRKEQYFPQWKLNIKFLEYQSNNFDFIVNYFNRQGKMGRGKELIISCSSIPSSSFLLNIFFKE